MSTIPAQLVPRPVPPTRRKPASDCSKTRTSSGAAAVSEPWARRGSVRGWPRRTRWTSRAVIEEPTLARLMTLRTSQIVPSGADDRRFAASAGSGHWSPGLPEEERQPGEQHPDRGEDNRHLHDLVLEDEVRRKPVEHCLELVGALGRVVLPAGQRGD